MKQLFAFLLLVPAVAFSAARPAPLPESRLTGTLHGEGQTITNIANVVTSNGVSLVGLSASKADASALSATSNTLAQAVALKADASALAATSNTLAQAIALKASTSALATTSNTLAQAFLGLPIGDPNAVEGRFTITSTAPLTLVVSNGLIYALDPNGTLVDVTYYLPAYAVTEPTTNYPAGFTEFDFAPNTTNMSALAPQISEWTRQALPGDTIALTAENLDSTTKFVFSDDGLTVPDGYIVALDERQCSLTLPGDLASNAFYLMWPYNAEGFGEPVGINRIDPWWIGQSIQPTNGTFSIVGRNISLGGGDSYLYVEETGEWLTSTTQNPYRAEFTVPSDYTNGTYHVWPHNGHGRAYGWARTNLVLTVVDNIAWTGPVLDITAAPYNCVGDGVTDDSAGFQLAWDHADATNYSSIYIPAGNYAMGEWIDIINANYVRVFGDGTNSIVTAIPAHQDASYAQNCIYQPDGADYIYFENHAYDLNNYSYNFLWAGATVEDGWVLDGIRVSQLNTTNATLNSESGVKFLKTTNLKLVDCDFILGGKLDLTDCSGALVKNCNHYGIRDQMVAIQSSSMGVEFVGGTHASYVDGDDLSEGAFFKGKGRYLLILGNQQNVYVGDVVSSNVGPSADSADKNVGEWVLAEINTVVFIDNPLSVSQSAITFDAVTNKPSESINAWVVSGTGYGQVRTGTISNNTFRIVNDEPWYVLPDTNSVIGVQRGPRNVVVYNNAIDGSYYQITNKTASTGIQAYETASNWMVENNTITDVRSGVVLYSWHHQAQTNASEYIAQPSMWNYVADNTISNTVVGITQISTYENTGTKTTLGNDGILGNVYRGNTLLGQTAYPMRNNIALDNCEIGLAVWDGNYVAGTNSVYAAGSTEAYQDMISNQVFVGNTFAMTDAAYAWSSAQGLHLLTNSYSGITTIYSDSFRRFNVPVSISTITDSIDIPLQNLGSTSVLWTAATTNNWINLSAVSGTIGQETNASLAVTVTNTPPAEGTLGEIELVATNAVGVPASDNYVALSGIGSRLVISTSTRFETNTRIDMEFRVPLDAPDGRFLFGSYGDAPRTGIRVDSTSGKLEVMGNNALQLINSYTGDWQTLSWDPSNAMCIVDGVTNAISTNVWAGTSLYIGSAINSLGPCPMDIRTLDVYQAGVLTYQYRSEDLIVGNTAWVDRMEADNITITGGSAVIVEEAADIQTNTVYLAYGNELGVE